MGASNATTGDGGCGGLGARAAGALVPFALWAAAIAVVSAAAPYRPALDDPELLHLARSLAEHHALATDGPFLRVPLWQLLLGAGFAVAPERAAVLGLQAACVALAFASANARRRASWPRADEAPGVRARIAVFGALALSPQLVLYARHTPTEIALGALALAAAALAPRAEPVLASRDTSAPDAARASRAARSLAPRFLALGAVVGAAAMTKAAGAALAIPAAVWALRARGAERFAARVAAPLAAGALAVVVPLAALALAQRGAPLDDTSAFNLGALDVDAWLAAGAPPARSAAALESFRAILLADPLGYLGGALERAVEWLLLPSSLELRLWIPEYPALVVEVLDVAAFFGIATLAVLGTTRASAPEWILPLALWLACAFPQKTPHTPKVTVAIALAPLAARGLASLGRSARTAAGRAR
ncbi:MAG: hypothetical protein R3E88_16485 [Myxococcota bacterium]